MDGNEIRKVYPRRTSQGVNRVMWDLRYQRTKTPKLRVNPRGVDWVTYNKDGWRNLRTWDLDVNAGKLGPMAVPGEYEAVLSVDGSVFKQTFNVTSRKTF